MKSYKNTLLLIQLIGLLIFMGFPLIFFENDPTRDVLVLFLSYKYWIFCIVFVLLYFLQTKLVIPRLLLQKKFFRYIAFTSLLFAVFQFCKPFERLILNTFRGGEAPSAFHPGGPPPLGNRPGTAPDRGPSLAKGPSGGFFHGRFDVTAGYLFIIVSTFSLLQVLVVHWFISERKRADLERENALVNLELLKAQVHPHFLFNTLNNIYSLAISNSASTVDSIVKLSNLLRYFMEELPDAKVSIEKEIAFVQDFIALQRLRLSANCEVTETYDVGGCSTKIYPSLLMPFIENAFKYGISKKEPAPIHISLRCQENKLHFQTVNKVFKSPNTVGYGIGLKNVSKRLNLLYPESHQLAIREENHYFTVNLVIELHANN
ncbi:sensor histidine kinase [Sphingobacterium sp. LRF_L2]|uniref:sensor histidine kinase n=1 Tax=Sphingobacterium sp. LRF_L2 TaxID=3369421 RepID=UPI003F5EF7DB